MIAAAAGDKRGAGRRGGRAGDRVSAVLSAGILLRAVKNVHRSRLRTIALLVLLALSGAGSAAPATIRKHLTFRW